MIDAWLSGRMSAQDLARCLINCPFDVVCRVCKTNPHISGCENFRGIPCKG